MIDEVYKNLSRNDKREVRQEEIQIRNDNKQNKIIIFLIIVYKSIRHINKILKNL